MERRRRGYGTPAAPPSLPQPGPASQPTAAKTGMAHREGYNRDDSRRYGFPAALREIIAWIVRPHHSMLRPQRLIDEFS